MQSDPCDQRLLGRALTACGTADPPGRSCCCPPLLLPELLAVLSRVGVRVLCIRDRLRRQMLSPLGLELVVGDAGVVLALDDHPCVLAQAFGATRAGIFAPRRPPGGARHQRLRTMAASNEAEFLGYAG
jgi:hypothetical protein